MSASGQDGDFEARFEILREIGRGGFGSVFEARQRSTGQRVAIKRLQLVQGGDASERTRRLARFQREMELSAALSHPNLVRLLDWGRISESEFYLVLEYVPGHDLGRVIEQDGALDPRETLHLMGQVLDALVYAHREGIVHRDLKPENIMITPGGARRNAVVLDFGVGRFIEENRRESHRLTLTNEILGTPSYSAPEQLRGETTTAASDVYAWSLIFLECLTGQRVMDGTAEQVLHMQFSREPVPIPAWLAGTAVGRMLARVSAKDPSRREMDVQGMFEVLEQGRPTELARAPGAGVQRAERVRVSSSDGAFGSASGERRQLSVVSCRLSVPDQKRGANAELLDELLGLRWAEVTDIAEAAGGVVASAVGERILLLFGYPAADEHDSQRAVATAQRIVEHFSQANERASEANTIRPEVHTGVHTGLVTTHELPNLVGVTPEIATRLDEIAQPGEILASDTIWRLVRNRFRGEPLGERALGGGGARPIFRLEPGTRRPVPSVITNASSPLVGRDREISSLDDLWSRVEQGTPQAALVSGEAGIGKSRLALELQQRVPEARWLVARCVPEGRDSPLHPISELLRGLIGDMPVSELASRNDLDAAEAVPLLASVLGRAPDPNYPEPALAPQRRQELTLDILVRLLLRVAESNPTVFLVEDLHWADPTTLGLLGLIIDEVHAASATETGSSMRLLMVATTRSEFVPPWSLDKLTVVLLQRLTAEQMADLARAGFGDTTLTERLLSEVIARAEGVPLFVEEVAHMVLSAPSDGGVNDGDTGEPSLEVPGTLRDLLMARLDQLDPAARQAAQLGAALGREFDLALLETISGEGHSGLRKLLDDLCEARLVHRRRRAGGDTYTFSHVLLRDAAYESMLRATRTAVHARIADALVQHSPALVERQPELLAHHLAAGDRPAEAIASWRRAGDLAAARSAHVESTRHYERALALVRRDRPSPERDRLELELISAQGASLLASEGYASASIERAYGRALELCRDDDDTPLPVLYGIWAVHLQRGDRAATDELALRLQEVIARESDPRSLLMAHNCLGTRAFLRGDLADGQHHLGTAMALFDPADHAEVSRRFGGNGGLYGHLYMSWCLWFAGKRDAARANQAEVLRLAESLDDVYAVATALIFGAALGHDADRPHEAEAAAERAIALSNEHGFPFWTALATCGVGWAATRLGDAEKGAARMHEGLAIFQQTGCKVPFAYYHSWLAEGCIERGEIAEGLSIVDESLALTTTSLERFYEAELYRLRGELLLRHDRPAAESEACFRNGLQRARVQGALSLELRNALSLARMLDHGPRDQEGRDELAQVLGRFTEGFDTEDLIAANAFLAGHA